MATMLSSFIVIFRWPCFPVGLASEFSRLLVCKSYTVGFLQQQIQDKIGCPQLNKNIYLWYCHSVISSVVKWSSMNKCLPLPAILKPDFDTWHLIPCWKEIIVMVVFYHFHYSNGCVLPFPWLLWLYISGTLKLRLDKMRGLKLYCATSFSPLPHAIELVAEPYTTSFVAMLWRMSTLPSFSTVSIQYAKLSLAHFNLIQF